MESTGERYRALDGLRGLAALVVVVHHVLLASPTFAAAYAPGGLDGWAAVLTETPLRLVWAGREAVFVFFVLSGFVLTLPFLREGRAPWPAYYAKRLVRLYLPVWAALVFAYACLLLVDRQPTVGASWWLNSHAITYTLDTAKTDMSLAEPSMLNSALWSLKWEVEFSLLLPLYLWVAVRARRYAASLAAVAVLVTAAGVHLDSPRAIYLPMFGLGVLMAVRRDDLLALGARMPGWAWAGAATAATGALSVQWMVPLSKATGTAAATVGAVLVVFLFLAWPRARRAGQRPVSQWLGRRSFSLYLVHGPIVVTLGFALPGVTVLVLLPLAVAVSLLAAAVFYRLVEAPSQRCAAGIATPSGRVDEVGVEVLPRRAVAHHGAAAAGEGVVGVPRHVAE